MNLVYRLVVVNMKVINKSLKCIDCGTKIKGYGWRCSHCSKIERFKNKEELLKLSKAQLKRYEDPLERQRTGNIMKEIFRKNPELKFKNRKGLSGELNPMYKDGRSIHDRFCIDCGFQLKSYTALRCNVCKNKGEHNPNYVHGQALQRYGKEFNEETKEIIKKRDDYICQNCSMTDEEHLLLYGTCIEVHHVDYNKQNNDHSNLITLCKQCNIRANYNREYWQNLYMNKMSVRRD